MVRKHTFFERNRNDLFCQVPISFAQAVLGGDIEVPTLDGPDRLHVPRGTQSGDVLRLKGRGMPDIGGRGRGDELVEVVVETPRTLTARQEELFRELAELDHEDVSPKRKSFFEKLRDYFTEEAGEPDRRERLTDADGLAGRHVRASPPARRVSRGSIESGPAELDQPGTGDTDERDHRENREFGDERQGG